MSKARQPKKSSRARKLGVRDLEALRRGAVQSGIPDAIVLDRSELPPEQKISWPLAQLLQEEVSDDPTLAECQSALTAIVAAWNISLLPEDERAKVLRDQISFDESVPPEMRHEVTQGIERLIGEKLARFPHDRRHIGSWEVHLEGDMLRVVAATTDGPRHDTLKDVMRSLLRTMVG
ncbi:hypothetical protein LBW62_18985 [Ralstonia solanacearum]|uniref:hypothetical protein n=1 Tax=Ralstonia solanacearum TaxID=305 RepID=UPI0005C5944A|nr:hypothetical protein [Ralstonia solanacearum]MDB0543290.1 hypothetical protein [Ralstonia solanacearum]MDB0553375.1 hypothetical protein [Ralstonia solanacearum]MDB0558270.1 hypothetical protein [Ralstonia solanacearum]